MADEKLALCLWFDSGAEDAAQFYCKLFPDSEIHAINRSPTDWPGGKAGDVLTIDLTLLGTPAMAMNGNTDDTFSNALSLQVFTETQEETDRYWEALLGDTGSPMACSWLTDRFGIRWQVVPRILSKGLSHEDPEVRGRVFAAMMPMVKIDHAAIEAAIAG
ncbi:VOC family protein [Qipengyuania sp. XHP0207]|uniref:VOC family protein n=1 Tax=Qipengyuania sp. XHP0207 TaxID=3038078 RepID=UPI00242048B5|nr:VOC family protein [Qipengyuania sp. XHP0207]MDG5748794.1 VOC family protein [Qipengyuania sp. XHP0207]